MQTTRVDTTMINARRRKHDREPQGDKEKVEPIDEVEQEREIRRLRFEAYEQMELIHNVFSRVCEGAMLLSLVLGVTSQDTWCWIHVAGSIFLHWSATRIVASAKPGGTDGGAEYHTFLPLVALLVCVAVFVYEHSTKGNPTYIRNKGVDDNMNHIGLAIANVLTMLIALYLERDSQSTKDQIVELEKSKYRYKSL
jgi:hypothetical protein